MHGKLYIITGPSGVGKTTVAMELLKRRPTLKKVVTCTTRSIREGELDGVRVGRGWGTAVGHG